MGYTLRDICCIYVGSNPTCSVVLLRRRDARDSDYFESLTGLIYVVHMHMPSSSISYTPPEGAVLINRKDEDAGRFDWDAVNNDEDIELCLIRVPEAVRAKKPFSMFMLKIIRR